MSGVEETQNVKDSEDAKRWDASLQVMNGGKSICTMVSSAVGIAKWLPAVLNDVHWSFDSSLVTVDRRGSHGRFRTP